MRDEHAALLRAVQKLPEEWQHVLRLRFVEGRSYEEISKRLGKRSGSYRVMQFHALAKLRTLLIAVVLALLIGIYAIISSLPGDALYGLKRRLEAGYSALSGANTHSSPRSGQPPARRTPAPGRAPRIGRANRAWRKRASGRYRRACR
jgi:hypothetical protein